MLTVTALAAGVMTIAMGAVANVPFALATGLGLNAVVAFQLVGGVQLTWPEAMGVVVVEGLVILLLVLTKFRQAVMDSVPLALKQSIAVGIGLFITIIGFIDAGFVTSTTLPNPPLQLGGRRAAGLAVLVFVVRPAPHHLPLLAAGAGRAARVGILATTVAGRDRERARARRQGLRRARRTSARWSTCPSATTSS